MLSTSQWPGPWHGGPAGFTDGRHPRRSEHGHGGRRRRGHRHGGPWGAGFQPPPPVPPFPPYPPAPPGPYGYGPPARRRKARRGDVRAAILAILAEGPHNGYQLIQEIGERSQGAWRPSPGAVYPALQQLADENLARPVGEGRKSRYELTEAGQAYVADNADEVDAPWEALIPQFDDETVQLFELAQQASAAMMQVVQSGSPSQIAKAKQIMADSRRALYLVLADGEDESPPQDD